MENSKPDENSRGSLIAISSIDGSIVQLYADPITHRLLVDLPGGAGTVTSITASTGILITPTPLTSTGTVGLSVPLQPLASLTGNAGKFLRVNAGETAVEYAPVSTGGVTSVSVTPANGFTGSVANATTTPAITLVLQNATTSQSGQLTSTDWNTFNGKQAALGYTPENVANKATNFTTINNTLYPTVQAVNNAIITAVTGLLDYRGSYNASTNLFPATGGSGTAGAILQADFWICSVAGTLGGVAVTPGDLIIAKVDTPGQTSTNWDLIAHDLGSYVTSVTGTTNRIVVTGTSTPVIDIASNYAGQGSIITVGTITTGVWSGTVIADGKIASALTGKSINGVTLSAVGSSGLFLNQAGGYTAPAAPATVIKSGVTTYNLGTASGTQNIPHGLGKVPSYIRINTGWANTGGGSLATTTGSYDGTNTHCISANNYSTSGNANSTTYIIINYNTGGSQLATVTMDSTNIILSWTKGGSSSSDTLEIFWEAQ